VGGSTVKSQRVCVYYTIASALFASLSIARA
jgi:hypothetical protein